MRASLVDLVLVRRAEEQMRSLRMDEPVKHDGWSIKPTQYDGRRDRVWRRERCLACDEPAWRGLSYCALHAGRIRAGLPVDADLYVITKAEQRRLSSGIRFGHGLSFGVSR